MKQLIIIMISLILLVALCACSRSTQPTEESSTAVTTAETTAVNSTDSAATTESNVTEAAGESTATPDTTAAAAATAAAATAAGNADGTTQASVALDDFMDTWHYTDTEMKATWKMELKGDTIQVTLSGKFADGEEMTETADCTYQFHNGVLELFSDEYEGGKLTLQFTDKDQLTATVNSEATEPIVMKR